MRSSTSRPLAVLVACLLHAETVARTWSKATAPAEFLAAIRDLTVTVRWLHPEALDPEVLLAAVAAGGPRGLTAAEVAREVPCDAKRAASSLTYLAAEGRVSRTRAPRGVRHRTVNVYSIADPGPTTARTETGHDRKETTR